MERRHNKMKLELVKKIKPKTNICIHIYTGFILHCLSPPSTSNLREILKKMIGKMNQVTVAPVCLVLTGWDRSQAPPI